MRLLFSLTGGITEFISNTEVILTLIDSDFDNIQLLSELGTDPENTYITANSTTRTDNSDNPLSAINATYALQALDVLGDRNNPMLISFELDIDASLLTLNFSESSKC